VDASNWVERLLQRARRLVAIIVGLFVIGYLIGGTEGYGRLVGNLRARTRAMLEPPTQREIQGAVARDSVDAQMMTAAVERARKEMPAGEPPRRGVVLTVIGGVFVASVGLMFLTGRGRASD
jgi:hypothetical protein